MSASHLELRKSTARRGSPQQVPPSAVCLEQRAGREDGLHNTVGSSTFPVAWQGSHSAQSKVSKGTHSLSLAVSALNYWSPGTRKLSSIWAPREPTSEQAFGEFPFLLQASISPRKSCTTLPESLYFPSCTAPTHCKQKIGQNREKRDPTAPTRQRESCFLKPGRSSGICSFISSRRGASVFPPVSLKHNSWISVSGADSLLLFKMHSHHN